MASFHLLDLLLSTELLPLFAFVLQEKLNEKWQGMRKILGFVSFPLKVGML